MKRVLIMGGSGFVSGSLARYMINNGYEVDILTRGKRNIDYSGYRNHFICDRKSVKELKAFLYDRTYDGIFDISAYTKEDVELLLSSIDLCKLKKYVFCSSGAVYEPSDKIICESCVRGDNANWGRYGLEKKQAEDFLLELSEKIAFPVIILRPTYIYGEGNNLYREAYFFGRIQEGKAIPVPYGNEIKTQFIHIDDMVRVFESALFNTHVGKAYNVTHPELVSWERLVETCADVMDKKAIIKRISIRDVKTEVRSYFPFRDVFYCLDITNLKKDGFYIPSINLYDGLKKTLLWYLKMSPVIKDDRMTMVEKLCE